VNVGEVADAQLVSPSFSAIWHASGLVKPFASRREAELSQAKPAPLRDARDLFILQEPLPRDSEDEAKAVALLDAAVQLVPGEYQLKRALAARLDDRLASGWSPDTHADIVRARAIAADLLRVNPNEYWGLQVLADSYMIEGRWQDCMVAADRVLAVKPDDAFALEDKAQARMALGDFGEADKILAQLAPFQAENDQFLYPQYVGKVRFHQGRLADAADMFRKALQVTPATEVNLPAFAGLRLYLAATEVEEGHLADARQDLRDFQTATRVGAPADFLKWNDNNRFVLTDWPRLRSDLAKIGWQDIA
jgi:tetratricopeptide (TPR) repeat protein